MLLNFITALAWLVGIFAASGVVVFAAHPSDYDNAAKCVLIGVLPWAWLLARYVL